MLIKLDGQEVNFPDFIIIGSSKAGTTSLYSYLDSNEQVFMSKPKEPNFFAFFRNQRSYDKNAVLNEKVHLLNCGLDEYLRIFEDGVRKVSGEASTCYIDFHENVIENIKYLYGDRVNELKLILLLRNPADKAFSHYQMFVRWGVERRSFGKILDDYFQFQDATQEGQADYISLGFYHNAVKAYKDVFGANLKIILFDDLQLNRINVVKQCFDFIGVESDGMVENIKQEFNVGGIPKGLIGKGYFRLLLSGGVLIGMLSKVLPVNFKKTLERSIAGFYNRNLSMKLILNDTDRSALVNIYRKDIRETEELINRDLSHWI